jgi:hypothetical protein
MPEITRASLLRRGIAGAVVIGTAGIAATAEADNPGTKYPPPDLAGVITAINGSSCSVSGYGQGDAFGVWTLNVSSATVIWRIKAVADLSTFRVGDPIAAFGDWSGSTLVATQLSSTMSRLHGSVVSVNGSVLNTTDGMCDLSRATNADTPSHAASIGARPGGPIDAVVLRNPNNPVAETFLVSYLAD